MESQAKTINPTNPLRQAACDMPEGGRPEEGVSSLSSGGVLALLLHSQIPSLDWVGAVREIQVQSAKHNKKIKNLAAAGLEQEKIERAYAPSSSDNSSESISIDCNL